MPFARLVITALIWPSAFVAAALAALVAGLGQFGRTRPSFDLLTHFAPVYLAVGAAALALSVLFHSHARWLTAGAGLAAVLASALLIAPEYLRDAGPTAPAGATGTLKLIQFNIWRGNGGLTTAANWLAAQTPDVVVLEEADHHVRDAILKRTGWHVVEGRNDVMIFSREAPIASFVPLTDATGPLNEVSITLRTAAGDATIVGVHYPWPTRADLGAQLKVFRPIIGALPRATTILSGDFNSTPWSFGRKHDDRDFGLIRRTRALYSWPTRVRWPFPLLPIDHVYAGAGWATVKVERGPNIGSDHYPVIVTLAPAAPH